MLPCVGYKLRWVNIWPKSVWFCKSLDNEKSYGGSKIRGKYST